MVTINVRPFTGDDVAAALQLCRAAGWNQLTDDWTRMVDYQPHGCFVADIQGRLVGTVTTTSYGKQLGWIGMMLVDPEFRRRGIATLLMNAALQYLRDCGVGCIKLDATPAGQPVYERLGFRPEWSFHRWQHEPGQIELEPGQHEPGQIVSTPPEIPPADTGGMPVHDDSFVGEHRSLDLDAFGVDRALWLQRMVDGSHCVNHPGGFGMIRPGHLATYLGPVAASDPAAAKGIIGDLLSHVQGTVFWDVPQPNQNAVDLAVHFGFQRIRDLTRMFIGSPFSPNIGLQYALCDPGTG